MQKSVSSRLVREILRYLPHYFLLRSVSIACKPWRRLFVRHYAQFFFCNISFCPPCDAPHLPTWITRLVCRPDQMQLDCIQTLISRCIHISLVQHDGLSIELDNGLHEKRWTSVRSILVSQAPQALIRCFPKVLTISLTSNVCFNCEEMVSCNLRILELHLCESLCSLTGLDKSACLHTLKITMCRKLNAIETLASCPALRTLTLSHNDSISSLDVLKECTMLSDISIINSDHRSVPLSPLRECHQVKTLLVIQKMGALTSADCISTQPLLQRFEVRCTVLDCFTGSTFGLLRDLKLHDCMNMVDLNEIAHATALKTLVITGFRKLRSLNGIACRSLEKLNVAFCPCLADIRAITILTSLTSLELSHCPSVPEFATS